MTRITSVMDSCKPAREAENVPSVAHDAMTGSDAAVLTAAVLNGVADVFKSSLAYRLR
jgi:hypothetical protein